MIGTGHPGQEKGVSKRVMSTPFREERANLHCTVSSKEFKWKAMGAAKSKGYELSYVVEALLVMWLKGEIEIPTKLLDKAKG